MVEEKRLLLDASYQGWTLSIVGVKIYTTGIETPAILSRTFTRWDEIRTLRLITNASHKNRLAKVLSGTSILVEKNNGRAILAPLPRPGISEQEFVQKYQKLKGVPKLQFDMKGFKKNE